MVAARVGNLGVDRLNPFLVPGPLSDAKGFLVLSIVLQGGDFASVRTCRQGLQAKVNANRTVAGWQIFRHFALRAHILATTGILCKASGFELALKLAGLPKSKWPFEVADAIVGNPYGARNKRYPAQSAFRSATCSKPWALSLRISRGRKLTANGLYRIAGQSEFCRRSGAKLDQIECRGPTDILSVLPTGLCLTLDVAAVIPHEIDRSTVVLKVLADRCVFYAIAVSEDHCISLIGLPNECKNVVANDMVVPGFPSTWSASVQAQGLRFPGIGISQKPR
jgi:hypothetical protein